jgi:GxxExxY protein
MRLRDLPDDVNETSGAVLAAAIEVHRTIGNRLSERTYRDCLAHELRLRGHGAETEAPFALRYKDLVVPNAYFVDVLADERVLVELKCVPALTEEHEAQLLTYLKMSGRRLGILLNFRAKRIVDDFGRFAN